MTFVYRVLPTFTTGIVTWALESTADGPGVA